MKTPRQGERVGDFEIIAELASDESGITYEARDVALGRVVTLKALTHAATANAHMAAALDHPNIGTIYQVGSTLDGQPFIAMARYNGEILRDRLARGPLGSSAAFDIARQVATGLAAAHAAGVTHQDIRPENIFITQQGLAKLLDFGATSPAGDARDDVRSLGTVLQEMLGGNGTTIERLPTGAARTLARMLETDPQKRYGDARELAADLDRAVRDWSRSRNRGIGFAVAAGLIIAIAIPAREIAKQSAIPHVPELAVLQVAGDSSDHETVELASALQDEIAARLVGLKRVRLVHLKPDSPGGLPSRAGLNFLRLSIGRDAKGPSVAISLEESGSSRKLWTDQRTFDRGGLRELGRDVVVGMLGALGQPATAQERGIIGTGFPSNAEAYEEFLVGNRQLALRSRPAIESALHHYRRASDLDSTFAGAFARQAYGYALFVDWGWKPSSALPTDMLKEGLTLANRAIALDSTSAEAWLAQAYILRHSDPRKFAGATQAFEYAIALDPYNAEAFHQYGQTLMALGRYTEAMAAYRRSLDLEPGRAIGLIPMAAIHERQGRLNEGLSLLDSAAASAPQIAYVKAMRSMFRSQGGDLNGARTDALNALALDSSYRIPALAALARVLWLAGDTVAALDRATEADRAISNRSAPDPIEAFWVAMAHVATHRPAKAVELLRNSQPRGAWLWFYFGARDLDEFRKQPEVATLLAEMDPRNP